MPYEFFPKGNSTRSNFNPSYALSCDQGSPPSRPTNFRVPTLTFGTETRYFYTVKISDFPESKVWYVWVPIQGQLSTFDTLTLMADSVSHSKRLDMEPETAYRRSERGGIWVECFASPRMNCADMMLGLFSHFMARTGPARSGGYDIKLRTRPCAAPGGSSSGSDSC